MTLGEIRQLDMVARATEWRDRIYINLKGNGGNYAGERNTKIWINAAGKITVERGKGMTTSDFEFQLKALTAAMEIK